MDEVLGKVPDEPTTGYPKVINIDYWYEERVKNKLQCIYESINSIDQYEYMNFFLVCFSVLVRKFSLCDPNISVPVKMREKKGDKYFLYNKRYCDLKKRINNSNILDVYRDILAVNISRVAELVKDAGKDVSLRGMGDDARYNHIKPESIDMIISSPPYAGAQKYIRSSSLNLGWLRLANDDQLKSLNANSIGRDYVAEKSRREIELTGIYDADVLIKKIYKINQMRAFVLYQYIEEIKDALMNSYRVLKKGGYMVFIVGKNTMSGEIFYGDRCIFDICKNIGLDDVLYLEDEIKSRSLLTKRNSYSSVIKSESVMVFKK